MSYRVIQILKSAHLCAKIDKKVFKCGYYGYRNIDMLCLSKGVGLAYSYNYSCIGTYINLSFCTMTCDLL